MQHNICCINTDFSFGIFIGEVFIIGIKKITAAVLCGFSLLLGGCGLELRQDKAGGELIKNARNAYTSLDSAKVIMTNLETNETEQVFTFKYDEKDTLIFSYYGKSENTEYAQFNNGVECFTYDNGEYSYVTRGDKDFSRYTRELTHPQADGALLIYNPKNITEASLNEENGITHVHHVYDPEKIGAQAETGTVTGFSADYYFSGEELLYFVETTRTSEKEYSYKVEITEKNAVNKVENTVLAL